MNDDKQPVDEAAIRATMTSEQIQLERKLTCEAIDGAIAFGYQNTNPPPGDDHWLTPYWKIGRQLSEAEAAHTESATPEASRQLAEIVLSMQLTTDKGLVARRLAREVLGVDEHGIAPNVVSITTNGTTRLVPRDEPVFLIRGQDAAGAATVRAWADMAETLGADSEILRVAREHADRMEAWPKKKTADLPRGSPLPSPAPSPVSGADERAAFEITEQMAADWADRNELENVLTSFSTQRNAIEDARTLHLLAPTPAGQQAGGSGK